MLTPHTDRNDQYAAGFVMDKPREDITECDLIKVKNTREISLGISTFTENYDCAHSHGIEHMQITIRSRGFMGTCRIGTISTFSICIVLHYSNEINV